MLHAGLRGKCVPTYICFASGQLYYMTRIILQSIWLLPQCSFYSFLCIEFHLRALKPSVEKLDFAVGSDVRLLCHSQLTDSKNVTTIFNFISRDGESYSATCSRNQNRTSHHTGSHWWIYRMKDAPHDCILRIQNVNCSDVGEYQCVGHLPISGKFEHASSNFENLTLYQNQSSPIAYQETMW